MYAGLWEKDRHAKCKREEMETTLQLERNTEMLQVPSSRQIYGLVPRLSPKRR